MQFRRITAGIRTEYKDGVDIAWSDLDGPFSQGFPETVEAERRPGGLSVSFDDDSALADAFKISFSRLHNDILYFEASDFVAVYADAKQCAEFISKLQEIQNYGN